MNLINDDIVISGIGGHFPKAQNVEELKTRLLNNECLLDARWKAGEQGVNNQIGKINAIDYFDNAYFGIHRQQSFFMDPMQRLILERTYEALIDAGVNPQDVKGRKIGCFMGSSIGENDNLFLESIVSGFGITGHSRAMLPNRVSYWLNLKGPSVAYDSNWVSGIEVLRIAFDAVRTGQCEAAIVGTANLALNAEMQWIYDDMGLVSRQGLTKSFDANADGYNRADGIVALFIQKASEAKRSYASIVNVDTCFSAPSTGDILKASSENMTEFLEGFYSKIDVKPKDVDFVEAYGCAIKDTDKQELDSLEQIYCKDRNGPLLVGCIKPNTGHSEASSSLFGVVKVLIAMEAETIPATINYDTPNPEISSLINGKIEIVTKNLPWTGTYAAVNAIGLNSYYGHVLLKSNTKKKIEHTADDLPKLVLTSTRTEDGAKNILETLKSKPRNNPEYFQLVQDLFYKPIAGHIYRGYSILGVEEEKSESEYHLGNKRQIWFVYSGMGSQWCKMVGNLMKFEVFANAINKCSAILKTKNIDLLDIISSEDKTTFDNILHSFVGIAAIQIGLTDLLHSVGIVPDGIIGHSVGELGCAYADGCVTAEQMILAAYCRGRASLEAELIKGMMAAVGLGYNDIKHKLPPTIEVACHNGPDSSTISGPTEDMEKFVKQLQDEGVFARLVNVSNIAYHSRYIKPAAPLLLKYLKDVIPTPTLRSEKWISTSNVEDNWNTDLAKHSSAEYHTNNLLSSVLFEEGLTHIPKDSILIEIAPHGLLQAILKRSVKSGCTNIPLTTRGCKSSVDVFLTGLGKMYLAGMDLNVSALYPKYDYPVSRGTGSLCDLVHWNRIDSWRTGLEGKQMHNMFGLRDVHVTLTSEEFRELVGHQFDEKIVLPIGYYLKIVYEIFSNVHPDQTDIVFENLYVKNVLTIPKIGSVPLHIMVQKGSGDFECVSNNTFLMSGRISFPLPTDKFLLEPVNIEIGEENVQLSGSDFYNELLHRGHKYSGPFKSLKSIVLTDDGSLSLIQWNAKWYLFLEAMIQQQLLQAGERAQEGQIPKVIQKIAISHALLPTEKTDLKVNYNYSTNIVSTEGIQIVGTKTMQMVKEAKYNFFDSIDFVPLNNATYSTIENGINTVIQLALDNFDDQYINNLMVTEIQTKNESLMNNIKTVLNQCTKLNPNIISVKDTKQVILQESYPLVLIFNDTINADIAKLVETCHGFILVQSSKTILDYPGIVQVAQFSVGATTYSILRKAYKNQPLVVLTKGDTLSCKDLTRGSVSWVSELSSAITSAKSKNTIVYLVSSVIPTEGFTNFVQELRSTSEYTNIRVLFTLDKRLSEFNLNDSLYETIFKQDLRLSVIKDGLFGTYLPIPLKLKENASANFSVTSNVFKNKTVNYIAVNLRDETVTTKTDKKNELGNIDYAGVNSAGQKIIGLASLDKDTCSFVDDSILCWNVPENWSLEDAATIPHAYTSAYYCLFLKGNLKPGETVLIHAGCTAIGLAAISIAHVHGCKVYTTVSTNYQRAYLKNMFNYMKDNTIFSANNSNFAPLLLSATGGLGVELILNCLSGNLIQCSLNCLASYGRFLQIGRRDVEESNFIGMNIFLKNTSFYAIDINNIFTLPSETKLELKEHVDKGLKSCCVRPIIRKIVEHQDIDLILNDLSKVSNIGKIMIKVSNYINLNKFNVNKPTQFICDAKSSYLVYGGSAENWTDITEWLILRGARKIVIASESKPQQNHINRRLSLLQSYYGADIIFAPNKAHTREGGAELLSEVYFLGPIHGVFLLPNKAMVSRTSEVKPVHYIDQALRTTAPKALFVNFINAAAGICHQRSEAGFCTYNIQWLKDLVFLNAIHGLDDILSWKVRNILVKNDRDTNSKQESTQALYKKMTLMLPLSAEVLCKQIADAPKEPKFVQLPTCGPREFRELIPLFIIGGLNGQKNIEELAKRLMYPTFCTVMPSSYWTLQELAAKYVEEIRKIWPSGPYNFLAISCGGPLTIEIARILNKQSNNPNTHIYFIDSAPNTLQSALKCLGEDDSTFEIGLLSRIFNNSDTELIQKIKQVNEFQNRVALCIENYEASATDKSNLKIGLESLKKRLNELALYQPNEEVIKGKFYLVRPTDSSKYDSCGLTAYCKLRPEIQVVQGDHLSIISHINTATFINETYNLI